VALLLAVYTAAVGEASGDWETKVNDEGRQVQSLKIEAPSMTEEDQYGYTMPDQYRCDACKVVTHHLSEALKKAHPTKNRRLKEWEYQELFDETCAKGFSGYGVALVHGQNVLSGPALKRDNLEPGMGAIQMGGETWEKRLGEICRKFVYEKIGEDEVYDNFRANEEVSPDLCFKKTRDCQLAQFGPETPSKEKTDDKKSPEDKRRPKKASKQTESVQDKVADISVGTFISRLAVQHGILAVDYTKKRSFTEWEQLFVHVAQKMSEERMAAQASWAAERQSSEPVDV